MKIAVFSNLWPPVFRGGYEVGAFQVVEDAGAAMRALVLSGARVPPGPGPGGLRAASVADSTAGRSAIVDVGPCVFCSLRGYARSGGLAICADLAGVPRARRRYLRALRAFRPDCLLSFNPAGVLAPVLDDFAAYGDAAGVPVGCYVSDHWLATWPVGHPVGAGLAGKVPRVPEWAVQSAAFLLRRAGLAPDLKAAGGLLLLLQRIHPTDQSGQHAPGQRHCVAPWGLAGVQPHAVPPDHFSGHDPLTLVCAGQILEHKG